MGRLGRLAAGITLTLVLLLLSLWLQPLLAGSIGQQFGYIATIVVLLVLVYVVREYTPDLVRTLRRPAAKRKAEAPPSPPPVERCSVCGKPLIFISQTQRWYCFACKQYRG